MTKKAIIFDLMGTLCHATDPEAIIIEKYGLKQEDYSRIESIVCGDKFIGWDDYLSKLIKEIGIESTKNNKLSLKKIIEDERAKAILFPETKDVLRNLKEEGYSIGLVSNAYPITRNLLESKNLVQFFHKEGIFLSYELGIVKPNPEIFKLCLKKIDATAEKAIMIGGSLRSDIKASKAATNRKIGGILISSNPNEETKDYCKNNNCIITQK